MHCGSLVTALAILCVSSPSDPLGTNGAGEVRTWTAVDGTSHISVSAAFVAVGGGMVTLSRTENYRISIPISPNQPHRMVRETGKRMVPIRVPLATLSSSDRRWIEQRNPVEACLTEKSKKGEVGTLSPKFGCYTVTKVSDNSKALIEYVRDEKVVWSFWLRSALASELKPGTEYKSISSDLVPNFGKLSPVAKERYGVDFKIVEKRFKKRGENITDIDVVEDAR